MKNYIVKIIKFVKRHKSKFLILIGIFIGFSIFGVSFYSIQFCSNEKVYGPERELVIDNTTFFVLNGVMTGPETNYSRLFYVPEGETVLYKCQSLSNPRVQTNKILFEKCLVDNEFLNVNEKHIEGNLEIEEVVVNGGKVLIKITEKGFFCFNKKLW